MLSIPKSGSDYTANAFSIFHATPETCFVNLWFLYLCFFQEIKYFKNLYIFAAVLKDVTKYWLKQLKKIGSFWLTVWRNTVPHGWEGKVAGPGVNWIHCNFKSESKSMWILNLCLLASFLLIQSQDLKPMESFKGSLFSSMTPLWKCSNRCSQMILNPAKFVMKINQHKSTSKVKTYHF